MDSVTDNLFRILTKSTNELVRFSDHFPDEQMFIVSYAPLPWYAHIVNSLAAWQIPSHWSKQEMDRFFL